MNRIDLDTLRSWTGTDADLARHCGVTRQAIHHARLTHGIPAPINGRVGPRHGLGRTLCTAVIREATRRAGSLADDAVRLDAIRAVLDDLNAWHKGGERHETAVIKTEDGDEVALATDRAAAAEQMVSELRAMLTTGRDIVIETSRRHTQWVEDAYDTIEASAPIANRWCMASERDAAIARADAAPDLLAACEALLAGSSKAAPLARIAIAKAKGEMPWLSDAAEVADDGGA